MFYLADGRITLPASRTAITNCNGGADDDDDDNDDAAPAADPLAQVQHQRMRIR